MIHHIALFRFHDEVPAETRQRVFVQLRELYRDVPGTTSSVVAESLDQRKINLVEHLVFTNEAARQQFLVSEPHFAAIELMKEVSDWWTSVHLQD